MPDFFGKSGIAWAGTQFLVRLKSGGELAAFYYDGFTDDKKECSFAALSFLEVVQKHFFVEVYPTLFPDRVSQPKWYTVFLDGAGCYVSLENLLTRIAFGERMHVYMRAMYIPEAYYNKTSLDGHFATAGKQMRAAVATGNSDAFDAASMFTARTNDRATGTGARNHVIHFQPNRDRQCRVKTLSSFKVKSYSERCITWVPNTAENRALRWRSEKEHEIEHLLVKTLKQRLTDVGVSTTGLKPVLVARLKEHIPPYVDPLPVSDPDLMLFQSLTVRRHSGMGVGEEFQFTTVHSWWDGPRQTTTWVQVVSPPTPCGGRDTDTVVSAGSTRPVTQNKGLSHVTRRASKIKVVVDREKQIVEDIKSKSDGSWCPECSRFFARKGDLTNHLRDQACQGGSVMFRKSLTAKDRTTNSGDLIKRTVSACMRSVVVSTRGATATVIQYNGRVQLPDGTVWEVSIPALGYAVQIRARTICLSKQQQTFLELSFSLGEITLGGHKSMKIGPRTTANHMKLLGTRPGEELYSSSRYSAEIQEFWKSNPNGKPTFRVHMLLDHWYIKSWFSTRKSCGPKEMKPWAGVLFGERDIASMSVAELRVAASSCGIDKKGKKSELASRLAAAVCSDNANVVVHTCT